MSLCICLYLSKIIIKNVSAVSGQRPKLGNIYVNISDSEVTGERKEMGSRQTKFGMLSWDLAISNLGIYGVQATLPPSQLCVMLYISYLSVFTSGRS